ncbi:MAG: DUF5916 domain-containing protein [Flammeovirgaceae bacterium]
MKRLLCALCWMGLLLLSFPTTAQDEKSTTSTEEIETKKYFTKRTATPPTVDGLLNDATWNHVEWSGSFTQRQPEEGANPSQDTKFRILYDQKYLYIGIRCFDKEPDKIVKRMSRRDGFEGDWVEVNIDSYFDKRTAFSFTITAAGVRGDEAISNNGNNWDSNWDPIWIARTNMDAEGWTAELKIPLSQLRFADKPRHVWGIQFTRRIFREEERSNWQFIPQNAPGWVHLFGELHGIEGIKPQSPLELEPFMVAQAERFEKEEGNPFATGRDANVTVGLNGKVGLTNDIILDFTINPDFGQVEADPSQINLSAFQVFFREQRPFFVEGNNILNFNVSNSEAGGNFNRNNLFYSRRIGSRPHGWPSSAEDGDYVDQPSNTRILGSAKITGKNEKGFSFGILESVTRKELATIDRGGERWDETVEPLTNYFVARAQQDFEEGKTVIGGMFTAVNRNMDDDSYLAEFLHKSAYSGGLDVQRFFKDRKYSLTARAVMSNVQGTPEAILNTQESSTRFLQRPDAEHLSVDPTKTSLTGSGGHLALQKHSGKLVFQSGVTWRTPELELNDAGFLVSTDQINQWTWVGYRFIQKTKGIFRSLRANGNQYLNFDFGGQNTYRALNFNVHAQFTNIWNWGTGGTWEARNISNFDLRGGPAFQYPSGIDNWMYLSTNDRKKLRLNFNIYNYWGSENYSRFKSFNMGITYRPINALRISLWPRMSFSNNELQYITTESMKDENRYIVGKIDQATYSMQIRLTYSIRPNLSIQYYGQPFASKGEYSDFKRITNSKANRYQNRYHQFNHEEISFNVANDEYDVDEDGNGLTDYTIYNPDFNFVEFRSNMVIRWEYIPGSTLFLVWTQNRTGGLDTDQQNEFRDLARGLFDVKPHDIFLVKFTYRFVR